MNAPHGLALMGYKEAALYAGITPETTKQLVYRRTFHSVKLPNDPHKYLLRSEVEWYRAKRAGEIHPDTPSPWFAWSASGSPLPWTPSTGTSSTDSTPSTDAPAIPRSLLWGAGGLAVLGMLLLLSKGEQNDTERALLIAAIAALALLLLAEMVQAGEMKQKDRRRIERLAKHSQDNPEPFVHEIERLLIEKGA